MTTTYLRPIELATRDAAPTDAIALRGIRVTTRLAAMGERTRVELTFANRADHAIEPIYTFPLPDGAAVTGFEVVTNERVLHGEIDAVAAAEERYEDAVERGDGAFLLEQDRDDVFTVRVGQLKAGQLATVRIDYVRAVEFVDRHVRFELPVTLAPRYADGSGMDPCEAALEADAVNPPKSFAVPYGLTFDCEVRLGRKVTIESPSHAIVVAPLEGDEAGAHDRRVTLADAAIRPNRSIVLDVACASDDAPIVSIGAGPDRARYLAVSFVPEFDETTPGSTSSQDVVFLIDCSGSMGGQSIDQARRALELCLRSLSAGDRFQIVRFGSTFETLFRTPQVYSAKTCEQALKAVRRIDADLGGTELRGALEAVLATPATEPGQLRNVLLLTDGQVSNEDATIALARDHAKTHRVFSFGIGPASSQSLVRGLARVTGGAAEFVTYDERIEDKVLRTFSRLETPPLTDVRVEWEGVPLDGAPELADEDELPPLFDGDAVSLRARCDAVLPTAVALHCKVAGTERTFRCALPGAGTTATTADATSLEATLWAARRITVLEDRGRGRAGRSRFDRSRSERRESRVEELGKTFGLVTSRTSFVAVEHRTPAERERGEPALQRIPVQIPVGWGALEEAAADMAFGMPCAAPMAPPPDAMPRPGMAASAPHRAMAKRSKIVDAVSGLFGKRETESMDAFDDAEGFADAGPATSGDVLLDLLGRQTADGDFDAVDDVLEDDELATLLSNARAAADGDERVARTLAVLVWLDTHGADRRATWRRAAAKARAWLTSTTGWDAARLDAALAATRAH